MTASRLRSSPAPRRVGLAALLLPAGVATPAGAAAPRAGVTVIAAASSGARHETSLWLVLDGPLLPRARRPRAASGSSSPAPIAEGAAGSEPPPASPGPPPPPPVTPPDRAPEPPLEVPRLAPALVRDTVSAARRAAATQRARQRLLAVARRARRAAALPDVQARGGRTTDESLELRPTAEDPYRFTESGQTRLVGELRLRWELDRVAFDPAELRLLTLEQARARAEAELVRQVLALLFAWHRGRVVAADPALDPRDRVAASLDAMEAALTLDVLTAGWFVARVAALEPLAPSPP